jgi:hypothetical protein
MMVVWKPPKTSWMKIDTDGARREDGRTGCGGVIRRSEGEWLGGLLSCWGSCHAYGGVMTYEMSLRS